MDKTIWKFDLKNTRYNTFRIPADAKILCLQTQNGVPCIWAEVKVFHDPGEQMYEERTFITYGTGHSFIHTDQEYIGTYQINGGSLIFHVYEVL